MSDVTPKGKRLISQWLSAQETLKNAKSSVNRAVCEESNAERELGKWLMPPDMKEGEKIAVWEGDALFQVELVNGDPKVSIRTRGKHMHAMRVA